MNQAALLLCILTSMIFVPQSYAGPGIFVPIYGTLPAISGLSGGIGGALGKPDDGYLEFDGLFDLATFSSDRFDIGQAGTLSFWAMLDNTTKRNQFFVGPGAPWWYNDAAFDFQYRENSGGQLLFYPNTQLGNKALALGSTNPPGSNVWFNVQYTWDINAGTHGEGHIYLNGAEVNYVQPYGPAFAGFNVPIDTRNAKITVGANPGLTQRSLDGKLDDVAFYDRVLTKNELDTVRTQGASNVTAGQVTYWNMDGPAGAPVAADSSGNGIDLYLAPSMVHYALNIVSPTTSAPARVTAGEDFTIQFDLLRNGVPLTDHVSVTNMAISGIPCQGTRIQKTEDFSSFSGIVPNQTLFGDGQLMVQAVGNATLEVTSDKSAVLTSPDENDGIVINSVHELPSTYITRTDVKIIDYDLSLTDRPENGFYWNVITDTRSPGPTDNLWPHVHRKVAIDIDNHIGGPEHPVYILYSYGDENGEQLFWNGSAWINDWVPAFTYENNAWYHTEIEKTESEYRISVFAEDWTLITRAVVSIDSVGRGPEDWFYTGEQHTNNWYRGQAAVDNISVTSVDQPTAYNPITGHWEVTVKAPVDLYSWQTLTLEAQYDLDGIRGSSSQSYSIFLDAPVSESTHVGVLAVALLGMRKRRS